MVQGRVRIEQHESAAGFADLASGLPDPCLRTVVEAYAGYSERSTRPISRREVPGPRVVLVIGFGDPIWIAAVSGGGRWEHRSAFVAGLGRGATLTRHGGRQAGVEVVLTPLGAFRLFGLPMHELTDRVVDLADLWGRAAGELTERLAEAGGWEARFEVLDHALARAVAGGPEPWPELVGAWRRIEVSRGDLAISDLTSETGWSRRRLAERFRAQVGLTPKPAARIVRFAHAVELLTAHRRRSLASIAVSCGYYDQAHLNRDFRTFAGCTPTEYLAAQLVDWPGTALAPGTIVQDTADLAA